MSHRHANLKTHRIKTDCIHATNISKIETEIVGSFVWISKMHYIIIILLLSYNMHGIIIMQSLVEDCHRFTRNRISANGVGDAWHTQPVESGASAAGLV